MLGRLDTSYFNNYARAAIHWTAPRLSPKDYEFLKGLELVVKQEEFTVVHGSMHMPEQFGYVTSAVDALESLEHQETRLCLVGHSHVPAIYLRRGNSQLAEKVYREGLALGLAPDEELAAEIETSLALARLNER